MTLAEADAQGIAILFYDGHCLMCSAGIRWLMQRDRQKSFRFAALQDPQMESLLSEAPEAIRAADSVILYRDSQFHIYSDAVLEALRVLGGGYRAVVIAYVVPRGLRNIIYRWVARNRKRWFGRSESCFFVPPDQQFRFLTDPTKDVSTSTEEE